MNAKEAKELAYKVNTNKNDSEYAKIKTLIENAAKKGKYSISYNKMVNSDVKKKLKEEGYKVEYFPGDYRSDAWGTINWG